MTVRKVATIFIFFFSWGTTMTSASEAPLVSPALEVHQLSSKFVDQTFEIYVQVPQGLADGSERFPVLYLTDSYNGMAFSDTTSIMQLGGDIPRVITVGIGYENVHTANALTIRTRDLTPVEAESTMPPMGTFFRDAPQIELRKQSGGAAEFLSFIREELQPFIDDNYPTIPQDRGYWGDSLGGLFGLYVLFNKPDTFNRYIIGSPSVWWGNGAILKDVDAYIESGKALPARVFMAVGANEAGGGFGMVQNVFVLEEKLRTANIDGLELTTHLFADETHTSVIAMNYVRGLQSVYDPPEKPYFEALLSRLQQAEAEE